MVDRPALVVLEFELEIAQIGNASGGRDGVRITLKARCDLLSRLQMEFRRNQALGPVEIEVLAMLDTLKYFVRLGVFRVEVMAIGRGHALDAVLFAPARKRVV